MRDAPRSLFALMILSAAVFSAALNAQSNADSAAHPVASPRHQAALRFDYARSNAPVGGSTSFNLFGKGTDFAWQMAQSPFSVVVDFSVTQAGNITARNFNLTQTVGTGGVRYTPCWPSG